ncbi:MAG TPA: STAS domain-containing protein [Thermoanaerobaculia bacterium]|nr:STAS domain-containing protein [Thermoanaerobaculia bacterium]
MAVEVSGRLDMSSAHQLEDELEALFAGGDRRIALDATGLDYLSSAGLRSILVAARKLREEGGSLVVIGLTGPVKEVFEMSGLGGVLDTYSTDRDLLAARPDWA